MRLTALTCLLAAALTSAATTTTVTMPEPTPAPTRYPFDNVAAHLALRQLNPGIDPNAAATQVGQVPPVTVYAINSQVGATAEQIEVTYTQLFSPVPDQWPAARAGFIGLGAKRKREVVEARATAASTAVSTLLQPVVLVMATEVVMRRLQRVMEVLVVETMAVMSNGSVMVAGLRQVNGTLQAGNNTLRFGNDILRVGNETLRLNNTLQIGNETLRSGGHLVPTGNDTQSASNDTAAPLLRGYGGTGADYAARTGSR